jgi:hypothetical protein
MQATIHESLREFDAARSAYRTLIDDARFSASPYRALAEAQFANLDQLAEPIAFTPGTRPPEQAAAPPAAAPVIPSIQPTPTPATPANPPPPATPAPGTTPTATPPAEPAAGETPAPTTPPGDTPPPATQPAPATP